MIKGMDEDVGHRSADDEQWQKTKQLVFKRDKGMCVLCRIMTSYETGVFMRSGPIFLGKIEPAHILSVGNHVELTYDVNNVVLLCHTHHQRMDSMLNPISGVHMRRSEHEKWWERIKKGAGIN